MTKYQKLQLEARNMVTSSIPASWLDPKEHPERLAALMVALVDAVVSIAMQLFGKENGMQKLSELVNSAAKRYKEL